MISIEDVKIDREFKNLNRGLEPEELRTLKANVIADGGFTEAFVVWFDGENYFLADGHNRLDVWCNLPEGHSIAEPKIIVLAEMAREQVIEWIKEHQAGRRNCSEKEIAYLRGDEYNKAKKPVGNPKAAEAKNANSSGNINLDTVSELIESPEDAVAKKTKSSGRTVRRDGQFATAIDHISKIDPKAAADIRAGSLKVSKADVPRIAKLPDAEISAAIKNLRDGHKWDYDGIANTAAKNTPSTKKQEMDEWNREVESFARKIASLINDAPVGPWLDESRLEHVKNQMKSAAATTRQSKCHSLTKPGCRWDRGTGYAPKQVIDQHYAE